MLKIVGAKGQIEDIDLFLDKIQSYAQQNNVVIQAFDADLIYGKNHLISAVEHAKRAISQKNNTTNSLSMEILLYASGERQLKLAIPKMGVKKGEVNVAIIIITGQSLSENVVGKLLDCLLLDQDDKVLEGDNDTLKKFGINKNALSTVSEGKYGDLILEKVAMVDIIK